jgi:hypothetical protein
VAAIERQGGVWVSLRSDPLRREIVGEIDKMIIGTVTQLLASCRPQPIPSKIIVFGGHFAFLLPAYFRENNPLESQSGEPSKNELKKRAKAAEKEKKAAEKAAKLAEQQREKAAAEEVRHLSPQTLCHPLNGLHPKERSKERFRTRVLR